MSTTAAGAPRPGFVTGPVASLGQAATVTLDDNVRVVNTLIAVVTSADTCAGLPGGVVRPLRAFVVTGPRTSAVLDVEPPTAGTGQVVDVTAAGILASSNGLAGAIEAYRNATVDPRHKILVDPHA